MSFYEFRKRIMEEKSRKERFSRETTTITQKTPEPKNEVTTDKNRFTITIIGLERAGKTSLVKKLLKQDDLIIRPTYGVNIENYQYRNLHFSVIDAGGHKPFRMTMWKKFIERADGLIFLVDSADNARFEESKQTFWHYSGFSKPNIPVMFIANKSDLTTSKALETIHEYFELDKFLRNQRPFSVSKISAKTGQGVYEAWDWIVDVLSGKKQWKVRISSAIISNEKGDILSEALFGRPDEQANYAIDYRKLKELSKLFALESKDSIQTVKLESLVKKHVSHVKRGQYCLSIMIDPIDPVNRAQQIQLRILEHFTREQHVNYNSLEEVLLSKFPLEVDGGYK